MGHDSWCSTSFQRLSLNVMVLKDKLELEQIKETGQKYALWRSSLFIKPEAFDEVNSLSMGIFYDHTLPHGLSILSRTYNPTAN